MTLSKNYQKSASAPSLDDLLRMQRQRQLQQESRSSVPDNEEGGYLYSSGIGSSTTTAAPRGFHRTAIRSMDNLRSIIRRAIAIIEDESDEEPEDSDISN
jgi:hypothetical protein